MKTTWTKRPDPEPRKDGRCVVCKSPRPHLAVVQLDPFCSTNCCKLWHRVEGANPNPKEV